MSSPLFAGVRILENSFAIDGVYDYRIPEELSSEVKEGAFVLVPFGTGNRSCIALVTELKETSKWKDAKFILSVLSLSLSLDKEFLGLTSFMQSHLLCTTGEAVKSMIPAFALSHITDYYSLTALPIETAEKELSPAESPIYDFIGEHGRVASTVLEENFGKEAVKFANRLCARGLLQKEPIFEDTYKEKTIAEWHLIIDRDTAERLVNGERPNGLKCSSEAQKKVLKELLMCEENIAEKELLSRAEVGVSCLKTLQKNGMIERSELAIERNPYAHMPFDGKKEIVYNTEQQKAVDTLTELSDSPEAKASLLYGVTGSGKTQVMMGLIDHLTEQGKGVILLLPEISLTPQSVSIFCARYGDIISVIHSGLSQKERYEAYLKIKSGKSTIVIGTRSAVFAPVKNLGAIIIDEEQEHTYKSDMDPKYHARDIARYRCATNKALMLLASATPSLESYKKAKEGVYTLIPLTKRYGKAKLPQVKICDMRNEMAGGMLSPLGKNLLYAMSDTLAKKEQAILFLNRRGYNPYVSCSSCGEAVTCPHCSVAMTYHTVKGSYKDGYLTCHFCGAKMQMPKLCPSCNADRLTRMGYGTQRMEEEISEVFPQATLMRMDADTTTSKYAYEEMLSSFRREEADILLGTQMVTKGHDFPQVTLVGILSADASLYLDDYRANERTFDMLTQVIGRAGRSDKEGMAIIQTCNPTHEVIRLACAQDYEGFYEKEIKLRELLLFPPFCDIALLTITGALEQETLRASTVLSEMVKEMAEKEKEKVPLVVFGPFEAPIYRAENKYRMRIVLKCKLNKDSYAFFASLLCDFNKKAGIKTHLSIDFNPTSL